MASAGRTGDKVVSATRPEFHRRRERANSPPGRTGSPVRVETLALIAVSDTRIVRARSRSPCSELRAILKSSAERASSRDCR